ncbi:ANTAR domain-containing protein [Paenibacillus validus]|nr:MULTISPECIES: ANTAR domain-containing protein [Paenibacillus]MED4600294.1 ANTAR domain-containing protein [Paenibacillus validus]MED4606147.1 ANTAR domain-containing protein [Paenibacillus validus]
MLQSFLLIDELEPTRAAASMPSIRKDPDAVIKESVPEAMLKDMGFRVYAAFSSKELSFHIGKADAVLLSVPTDQVANWRSRVLAERSLPVFWWCDRETFPSHACKLDPGIDGLLGSCMSELEIHCALLLGVNHYFQRTEWQQEREQLLSKLEERKWVDQAKRILCEIKHISEAEAYDFLRKQAMNERKRMVDVATSIVKVYQLLQDENKGGRRR